MKKLLFLSLVVISSIWLCNIVAADVTSGADWAGEPEGLIEWLNSNDIDHDHSYTDTDTDTDTWRPEGYAPERRNPFGIGTNLLLWDNEDMGVIHQYRYDWQNSEHTNYVVINNKKSLWEWLTGNGGTVE